MKSNEPMRHKLYELIPQLQSSTGGGRRGVRIPCKDMILVSSPNGGMSDKQICYNRNKPSNFTNEWQDPDVDLAVSKTRAIEWGSGHQQMLDPFSEKRLIEYFDLCNYNESNPNRDKRVSALFREIDTAKAATDVVKNDREITLAKSNAYDGDINKLTEIMYIMGLPRKDSAGQSWTEDQIRHAAIIEIDNGGRVDEFTSLWTDATIQYRITIEKAVSTGVIIIDKNTSEVKWGDNGKSLQHGKVPYGVEFKQYLVDWVKLGGSGKTFYDEVLNRLMSGKSAEEMSADFRGHTNTIVDAMSPEDLAQAALDYGVITRVTPYYVIGDSKEAKDRICKSKDELVTAINNNVSVNAVELTGYVVNTLKRVMA